MTTFHNLVLASGAEGVGDLELADKLDSLCLSNYHNAKNDSSWRKIYMGSGTGGDSTPKP